ncbi:MAG: VOC family protein [Chloroflexi bacterium]|nr:VOC family protein [Chloroflexota bacterium]
MPTYVFSHIGICVTNIQRSRDFYEQALGFQFIRDFFNKDHPVQDRFLRLPKVDLHAVYLQKDGFQIELLYYASPKSAPRGERPMNQPGMTHLSLKVDDVPAAIAAVKKFGGKLLEDTVINDRACFVHDPDGQLIELVSSQAMAAAQGHH